MSIYTVSQCLLTNLDIEKKYVADILMFFAQSNPYKVALDKDDKILALYASAAEKNALIACWLDIMSKKPTSFEFINADTSNIKNDEQLFLTVCVATKNQQKIIVYSHQDWKFYKYEGPNTIKVDNACVTVYDKDEAIPELSSKSGNIYAINSVVATNNSNINDTKNRN